MKESFTTGISFGLTSGVITTLGLIVGLHAGTHQKLVLVGGVLTIAIADALSDAVGIHVAEESKNAQTEKQVWAATLATFISKFFMALSFLFPILVFELSTAVWICIGWGLFMVCVISYKLASSRGAETWKVIGEHLGISLVVIMITHYVGVWVSTKFQ